MNGLDLFSGIGGITLALNEWVKPIAYCEIDRYAQSVLLSRIADEQLPRAPIWNDITSLNGTMLPSIDIIYGGFPCQDISVAGNGIGLAGERSGLFFHIARLVKETNPRFIFLENVPAIRTRGLNSVVQTLTELGYDCRWTIVSAAEVGAPHLRKRWFLLAHSHSLRLQPNQFEECKKESVAGNNGEEKSLANTNGKGFSSNVRGGFKEKHTELRNLSNRDWWTSEPDVDRVVYGLPYRVDRIKGLGNSVVPFQAKKAFMKLMGLK